MTNHMPLLQPAECAFLLIDQQAGLEFGVGSTPNAAEHPVAVTTQGSVAETVLKLLRWRLGT
jgi:hypothetical protein